MGRGGGGRKGRNTCTAATQQFRVRCYVSESVMPMWAEANLWSPVSARTCVASVYVRGTRNSRVTYAGTYRRLRTPLDPSPPRPRRGVIEIGIGTRAGSLALLEEIPRFSMFELCEVLPVLLRTKKKFLLNSNRSICAKRNIARV